MEESSAIQLWKATLRVVGGRSLTFNALIFKSMILSVVHSTT